MNTIGWSFPINQFGYLYSYTFYFIMLMSTCTIPSTQDQFGRGRTAICVHGQTGNHTNAGRAITPFMFNEEEYCVSVPIVDLSCVLNAP